jgi:hypothetical protein
MSTYSVCQVERNERKMDAKIDMLHQAGLIGSPQKRLEIVEEAEGSSENEDEVSSSRIKHPCWFGVDSDLERRNYRKQRRNG